ncbi:thiamine-phosphate pyrophosphorylase [Pedobacter sp. CG_S7]|uniref:thiamine phosphate synthase n=1 Tax=Pedobacter sp. CG_S7 TaxID=3143930 RepID=UPI00339303AA
MIDKLQYISPPTTRFSPIPAVASALAAGCKWIQLRVKDQPENMVLQYALAAKALCEEYQAKLIINDYPEIALLAGAYGVHLGLVDMPVKEARLIVGQKRCIGGTANTFEDILQKVVAGVDYIGLGPFKFTFTKKNLSPIVGLAGYKTIMEKVKQANISLPIIAIGGIELEDIPSLMQTGIYGVAISAALTQAKDRNNLIKSMYRDLNADL